MSCTLLNYSDETVLPGNIQRAEFWIFDEAALARALSLQHPDVPRLLISSYRQLMTAQEARDVGVLQQVASPPPRARLAKAIGELFSGRHLEGSSSERTGPRSNRKILLVEDNMVNQMVARGMLNRLGYDVEVADHGEAALELLEDTTYDLVLMDCNMPVMDGYETSRRMRDDSRWQHIPIIALTANALHEDRQRCEDAGMNDYLSKPFKREDLQHLLDKWLENPPSDDPD